MMVQNFQLSFSCTLFLETQRKWSTTKQEAYGVYYAITKWNYYLQGADILVRNDHKTLTKFLNGKNANNKVNRWALELATYNITFEWISGTSNKAADCLSCLVDLPQTMPTQINSLSVTTQTQMDPPLTPEVKLPNASPSILPPHSQILCQMFQKYQIPHQNP